MSGYKRTIQEFDPALFITFDGEPFAPQGRLFTHSPLTIFDESGIANDGILQVGFQEPTKAYRAGMPSLVPLEPAAQQSISFGHYGKVNGVWPKAIVQVPSSVAYNTTANQGSFTLVFMFKKERDESDTRIIEPSLQYSNFTRTLFSKLDCVTVTCTDVPYGEDVFTVVFPNQTLTLPISLFNQFYNQEHHVVIRWKCGPANGGNSGPYEGQGMVIVDGEVLASTVKTTYADVPPSTYNGQAIEIGGNSFSSNASMDDRATSPTYIDQIALFTRALSDVEVWRLFKKVWQYEDMITRKNPVYYCPMEDNAIAITNELFQKKAPSGTTTTHVGPTVRSRPGPTNIPGSRCVLLSRGMLVVKSNNYYSPQPFSLDVNKYAFEFWINTGGSDRAVILSMQSLEKPFKGPLVELNVGANGAFQNGAIRFSENESGAVATTPGEVFNNGGWHHVIAQRNLDHLELFVDGAKYGSVLVPREGLNSWPSQLSLMGSMPGDLYCEGFICQVAAYTGRVFSEGEASTRYQYVKTYRVRGNTTLRAVPYRARVRLYDYRSGELVDQQDSEPTEGQFEFYLANNSMVCAQILAMNDTNVRVRGFGPILPAELDDPYSG